MKTAIYNHREWSSNRERQIQYLGNISSYPMRYLDKTFEERERRANNLKRLGLPNGLKDLPLGDSDDELDFGSQERTAASSSRSKSSAKKSDEPATGRTSGKSRKN
jgi:hypothetical protein